MSTDFQNFILRETELAVIFIISRSHEHQIKFSKTMKTTAYSSALENLSLMAIISCAGSSLYFLVTNLLA
jgi:hypothetical protein